MYIERLWVYEPYRCNYVINYFPRLQIIRVFNVFIVYLNFRLLFGRRQAILVKQVSNEQSLLFWCIFCILIITKKEFVRNLTYAFHQEFYFSKRSSLPNKILETVPYIVFTCSVCLLERDIEEIVQEIHDVCHRSIPPIILAELRVT